MGDVSSPVALRPLSIGEIFDRAVTLLVRNWQPFLTITMIGIIPGELFQYLALTFDPGWNILRALSLLLVPVATIACTAYVAQIYRNEHLDWRVAFSVGFGKILSALGVNIMMGLIAMLPLLVIVGVPAGLGVFRFGNVFTVLIAVLVIVVGAAIVVTMAFCAAYAFAAMGIDDYRATDAVGRALAQIDQKRLGRTLLFALAQQVLVLGGSFAGGFFLGVSEAGLHNAAVGTALEAVLMLITNALGNVLIGVYYFDVAIRSEGYDLQVALDSMPTA